MGDHGRGIEVDERRGFAVLVGAAVLTAVIIAAWLATTTDDPQRALGAGAIAAGATADVQVTKSDSPDPVVTGTELTYTIAVKNNGPNTAFGTEVSDKLSGSVDFVSATATKGSCTLQGNTVTCALGDIADGATVTVTLKVKPKKKSGKIDNTASAEITNVDPKSDNDEDTETTTVVESAVPTCKGQTATIVGTAGNDAGTKALIGTNGADVVAALGGDDEVRTKGGKDVVCGGAGDDDINTGGKADKAAGGDGKDKLTGGGGGDKLSGQGGNDKLVGKGGGDTLRGQGGKDVLKGNGGGDLLVGGPKNDKCKGGPGKDELKRC